jgi:hypothetical protein
MFGPHLLGHDPAYVTANRFWHPEQPFNELPLLPPPVDLETKPILKQCIAARAAASRLGLDPALFNPQLLGHDPAYVTTGH